MEGFLCGWAFIAVLCAVLGKEFGERREVALGGSLLGLIFGPIGLLLIPQLDGRSVCPACREPVNRSALVCGHCRTALAWVDGRWRSVPRIHPDSPLGKQLIARGVPIGAPPEKSLADRNSVRDF